MSEDLDLDRSRGGVPFRPTEEQRRLVKVMSGFGIPQPDIAAQIGVDAKTLRKHFREELDRGMTEANMRVAQSLFTMATSGNNVAAAIFWMKARAGWREKHEVVVSEGVPEPMTAQEQADLVARIKAKLSELEGPPTITGHASDVSAAPQVPPPHELSLSHSTSFGVWPRSTPTNDR